MTEFLIGLAVGLVLAHFALPYLLDWPDAVRYRHDLGKARAQVAREIVEAWGWTEDEARQWAEKHYHCPFR